MGMDYAGLLIENTEKGLVLSQAECKKADKGSAETVNKTVKLSSNEVYLRARNDLVVECKLSYSKDGKKFKEIGETFQVKEGKWIGAKVGTFCTRPNIKSNDGGWVDVDWFRITKQG